LVREAEEKGEVRGAEIREKETEIRDKKFQWAVFRACEECVEKGGLRAELGRFFSIKRHKNVILRGVVY
jgi:hypothetical protein